MGKSLIQSGTGIFKKSIEEISANARIMASLHDFDFCDLLSFISSCKDCLELTILLNINPDEKLDITFHEGETLRYREKAELAERLLTKNIESTSLNRHILSGLRVCSKLIKLNRLKIHLNVTKIGHGQQVIVKNNEAYYVCIGNCINTENQNQTQGNLAQSTEDQVDTIAIKRYLLLEDSGKTLEDRIKHEINRAGGSLETEILRYLTNAIHIEEESTESLFRYSLYEINKHHINSSIHQKDVLNNMNKAEFKFQTDGVDSLISILTKYNLAYLGDSVGLGKTIIALRLLAKTKYRALVIVPTDVVMQQWKEYIADSDGIFMEDINISFVLNNYQAMNKFIQGGNSEYDIVIFDEAHHFRNIETLRYKRAQEICSGKRVLLVGATPINNGVSDVEAQLLLGINPNQSYDFGVGTVGDYLSELKKSTRIAKSDIIKYRQAQEIAGNKLRNNIISKLMVRRTRADIEKYYKEDIESGRLHFPKVNKPILVSYKYSGTKLANTLDILSGYNNRLKLTYALYNKSNYIKERGSSKKRSTSPSLIGDNVEKCVESVENLTLGDFEDPITGNISMTGLTKVRLIKLLDSSPYAFISSLLKMIEAINNELDTLENTSQQEQQEQQCLYTTEEGSGEGKGSGEEKDPITQETPDTRNHLNQYIKDLKNDRDVLMVIAEMWMDGDKIADADIKVNELLRIIENNHNRKIVIFTEYIATADGVYRFLTNKGYRVLKINGKDKRDKAIELRNNFSISGNMSNDYDILISTNILSEGINLNRASVAINYDITWNPMVIVQRVGRLNRIDSLVDQIDVYNFFPCDEMDSTILSESNIISKYALATYSIGSDENYLCSEDDKAASMMEYKESIAANMQTSIVDEQFDFRSVDFRYSDKATSEFNSAESINSIVSGTHIATVEKHENEEAKAIGLYKIQGKIITCELSKRGFRFIDFNEYLDEVSSHTSSEIKTCDSKVFNTVYAMTKEAKQKFRISNTMSKSQIDLFNIVDRLEDYLSSLIESDGITNISILDYLNTLRIIKHNIRNNLLNGLLCKWYAKDFIDGIGKASLSSIEQTEFLINRVIQKRFTVLQREYDSKNNLRLLSFLCII